MIAWPRVWCGGPKEPVGAPTLSFAYDCRTANEANGTTQRWAKVNRRAATREATLEALSVALVGESLPPAQVRGASDSLACPPRGSTTMRLPSR